MMRRIIAISLKFRLVVLAVAAGMLAFGIPQLGTATVDILPEFTPPVVEVHTEALGLSAEEVEQLITVPLEQDLLNGVAFLDTIESASLPGLSSVVMTFEPGTDLLDARQVVAERLALSAGLPQVAAPPQMLQPLSTLGRVAMAKLSSEELSPIDMSVLARWVIAPRLLGVEGVANVAIWGFRDRQLQVLIDPQRLARNGITVQDIVRSTGNALEVSPLTYLEASSPGTGGFIDTLNQRLQIFHEQTIRTPEQLAQITIEDQQGRAVFANGRPLALGAVTDVVTDHQPLIGDALCSEGECIMLVIEKFPQANTRAVTEGVDSALAAMAPGLGGIEIDTSLYRPARYIDDSFGNIARGLLIGGILLLLVLAVAFFDWRAVLISAAAITASMVAAGLVLVVRDATVNMMVIAGLVLAIGLVIQDAVSDVDGLLRRLRDRREDGVSGLQLLLRAALAMRSSLLFGTVIALVALVPAFVMPGEAGAFLPSVATSYALAIAAAMVAGLTIIPALGALLLAGSPPRKPSPAEGWLTRRYDALSPRLIGSRGPAFAAFGVVVAAALVAAPFLSTSVEPKLREPDVLIHLQGRPGTSLPRMDEVTSRTVERLGSLPGVRGIAAQVGRAVTSDRVVNVNSGDIWVGIDSNADYDATRTAIEETVDDYVGDDAGLSFSVGTYSEKRVNDLLQRTDDDVVVRVYGEDPAILRAQADEVRDAMAGVNGVEEPVVDLPAEEPTIEVRVDLERAQAFGIKPGDVRRQAAILLSGLTVGNLFEEQKVFDVVVWGKPSIRTSVADVRRLQLDTPSGRQVRLGRVAEVAVVPNPTVIRHESVMTFLDVASDVSGRGVSDVAADVDAAIKQLDFPLEYHAEVLGDAVEARSARGRAIGMTIAAAFAIFLLLQAAFGSWRLATLAFLLLPMALAGGILAVAVTGAELTIGAIAGLAGVLGLAARETVIAIRRYRAMQVREHLTFGPDLVAAGTRERLLPTAIMMVASTLVLLPFLVAGGTIGYEIVQPLAVAFVGGVITTGLLALVVLPAMYLHYGGVDAVDETEDLLVVLPDTERIVAVTPEALR